MKSNIYHIDTRRRTLCVSEYRHQTEAWNIEPLPIFNNQCCAVGTVVNAVVKTARRIIISCCCRFLCVCFVFFSILFVPCFTYNNGMCSLVAELRACVSSAPCNVPRAISSLGEKGCTVLNCVVLWERARRQNGHSFKQLLNTQLGLC